MSQVTTHVLDSALGIPAEGVGVLLETVLPDGWSPIGEGETDADGRIGELGPSSLPEGWYRLTFATDGYFTRSGRETFYPEVSITFAVTTSDHYHVPLLLSPFGYTTYRGS
ncbi:hydroxyisourate hydrolase [Amnibacterium flavum]|uniref:5-hydroxyisourate hydrolase n=1 Tax=Amnibacterium flavum TaxID=2173173 RepID=A0A2V1HV95_9MICO|nr:hydroxyisourate hydrolase [Amnibacterium flavum]PVZ95652.1 hydroxyisourate hydrolase [Amnibacterium flavum]